MLSESEKPVAELWYALKPVADDILRLNEIHVDPYSVGDSWLVRGTHTDLVIDTCSGIVPLAPIIDAISNKRVLAVALNHSYDHAGGWRDFRERACHPADAPGLRHPTDDSSLVSTYLDGSRLFALPRPGYTLSEYRMRGAEPTQLLKRG